jgi:hypothetical protein
VQTCLAGDSLPGGCGVCREPMTREEGEKSEEIGDESRDHGDTDTIPGVDLSAVCLLGSTAEY